MPLALPAAKFEALLERASETGARRAVHEVGLDGQDAAEDLPGAWWASDAGILADLTVLIDPRAAQH